MKNITIPARMRHLPLDPRGYPVPVTVYRDDHGKLHFAVNDELARQRVIIADRCPICGGKLLRGRWFVGGPRSAFDPHGAYIDPPMHYECMQYALQVCPYLAAPRYSKMTDGRTLSPGDAADAMLLENTTIPGRPATFVAVMATAQTRVLGVMAGVSVIQYLKPIRPYVNIEFWRQGRLLGKRNDQSRCRCRKLAISTDGRRPGRDGR